jgi:CubicO group peptidase (beta-lactamase class C family)
LSADLQAWTPGTKTGYHALTWGFLLGELVRRATGRTLAAVLREEIAAPLRVADELHFGVPRHLLARVARAGPEGASTPRPDRGSSRERAVPPAVQPTAAFANRHDILAADIPSQGTMTARAAARMYAALLGHIDGVQLISTERLQTIAAPAFSGIDQVMGVPTTWALGYSPARLGSTQPRPGSTFGMVGSNGTAAYADIDSGVAVAGMRNQIAGDFSVVAAMTSSPHTTADLLNAESQISRRSRAVAREQRPGVRLGARRAGAQAVPTPGGRVSRRAVA